MFWKVSSFSSGNAIEAILDKQTVTVEELLDEDDLIQVVLCACCLFAQVLISNTLL